MRVGIVGGGAAGALVAINLLRNATKKTQVIVFEPSLEIGRGVPYGTADPAHLLNVRAANMSGFVDRPSHFAEWYASRKGISVAEAGPIFAPRCEYGAYIGEILAEAVFNAPDRFRVVQERASSVEVSEVLTIRTSSNTPVDVDELVLATGHLGPQSLPELANFEHNDRYVRNPWSSKDLDTLEPQDTILLLGTGLTMVDLVISLALRGHQGLIIARSRRGLLPRPHRVGHGMPLDLATLGDRHPIKPIIQALRSAGDDWRLVMDGLRPHTQALWEKLSWEDRRRFIEKLRPFWDVHRHRIPESTHDLIGSLVELGRLDIGQGRIDSVTSTESGFNITTQGANFHVNRIINCTGPNLKVAKAKIPILESVVSQGLASYDPLGLGLIVDSDGRTAPQGHVWALGPLCRGSRWETTAIPEIRTQAARIADLL
jgi:uncharacterized NAD(P)/FAD-binding protein YdhS